MDFRKATDSLLAMSQVTSRPLSLAKTAAEKAASASEGPVKPQPSPSSLSVSLPALESSSSITAIAGASDAPVAAPAEAEGTLDPKSSAFLQMHSNEAEAVTVVTESEKSWEKGKLDACHNLC